MNYIKLRLNGVGFFFKSFNKPYVAEPSGVSQFLPVWKAQMENPERGKTARSKLYFVAETTLAQNLVCWWPGVC